MRTEDRRQRTNSKITRWWARDKENYKKYLFFPILFEEYLRDFDKQTFEMQGKVNRKKAQKGTRHK